MKSGDYIFVYGTLRRGESADLSKGAFWGKTTFIDTDHVNGDIYNLGSYPGAKIERQAPQAFDNNSPSIVGDVFLIQDDNVPVVLDQYEGYPSLYTRCEVLTMAGRTVWVYVFAHPVSPDQLIPSGDWTKREFRTVFAKPVVAREMGL